MSQATLLSLTSRGTLMNSLNKKNEGEKNSPQPIEEDILMEIESNVKDGERPVI